MLKFVLQCVPNLLQLALDKYSAGCFWRLYLVMLLLGTLA